MRRVSPGSRSIDNYQQLLVALRRINRATDLASKRLAKDSGLTTPQLLVMQATSDAVSLTVTQIAREINLTQATTTSIVNGLERRGLLDKRRDNEDKRRVIVSLTQAGRTLIQNAPRTLQQLLGRRFEGLEPWEQSFVLAAVQKLASLMDAEELDAAPMLHAGAIVQGLEAAQGRAAADDNASAEHARMDDPPIDPAGARK